MALPTLTLDKTETDKIIALFGDQDAYLARNLTTVIRPVARLLTFPPAQVVPSGRTAHL